MTSHRSTHYGLQFLLFGLIPLVGALTHHSAFTTASGTSSTTANWIEAAWLGGAGIIALLLGNKNINDGKLAQPFDLLIGAIFTIAGVVGLANDFGISGVSSLTTYVNDAGLLLGTLYPVVYAFLGLRSLHHGLSKNP